MPYQEATKLVSHPVACIDCHHPETMQLRITRPAFIEGIKALKASEGVKDYDVNSATAQEMRTYVCAQCHVEYYFKGDEKRLVFPWTKGLKVEDALATTMNRIFVTGCTRKQRRPCSRRSTLNSRFSARAYMRARAWPAPTATCLISDTAA